MKFMSYELTDIQKERTKSGDSSSGEQGCDVSCCDLYQKDFKAGFSLPTGHTDHGGRDRLVE